MEVTKERAREAIVLALQAALADCQEAPASAFEDAGVDDASLYLRDDAVEDIGTGEMIHTLVIVAASSDPVQTARLRRDASGRR